MAGVIAHARSIATAPAHEAMIPQRREVRKSAKASISGQRNPEICCGVSILFEQKQRQRSAGEGEMSRLAIWLGGLGLIPFFALMQAIILLEPGANRAFAVQAHLAYGATILAFLGGVHWGLVVRKDAPSTPREVMRLILSVVPQLVAFGALLLPFKQGLALVAMALLLVLPLDFIAKREGAMPDWFYRLRMTLSAVAAITLAVTFRLA
jgi:Protein of unknown function (DUF3429)